jgi:hypothetical protein
MRRKRKRPKPYHALLRDMIAANDPQGSAGSFGVRCETYRYNAGGNQPTTYKTTIYERQTRCSKADAIVRDFQRMGPDVAVHRGRSLNSTYWTLKKYRGWHCNIGAGGGACVHGRQIAQYVFG